MSAYRWPRVLIALSLLLVPIGCRDSGSASTNRAPKSGMTPPTTLPAGPPPMRLKPLPPDADDLARVRHEQQALGQIWLSLRTVDDLKAKRGALLTGTVNVARLTLKALKGAMELPLDQQKAFFKRNARIRRQEKELSVQIRLRRRALRKLPGGEDALTALSAEVRRRAGPIYAELVQVTREIMKRAKQRRSEAKASAMSGAMTPAMNGTKTSAMNGAMAPSAGHN